MPWTMISMLPALAAVREQPSNRGNIALAEGDTQQILVRSMFDVLGLIRHHPQWQMLGRGYRPLEKG